MSSSIVSSKTTSATDRPDIIVCPLQETGPGNLRNSEASMIELRDGRLLLHYTHFYSDADDFGSGDIRGKISSDGGLTWGESFGVEANTARCNVGRLSLLRMPKWYDGYARQPDSLAHVYVETNSFYHNRLFFKTSTDEGKCWSAPVQINDTGTLGHICQRGDTAITLSSGRILVPVYGMFGGMCASYMYYSDDAGVSWKRSLGEIAIKLKQNERDFAFTDFEEPCVAELADGRLLCLGRTRLGQLYRSYSKDRGVTWSEAEPSGLASSYSPAALRRIPGTDDLLCVWNQATTQEISDGLGRMRLSCATSSDGGTTWENYQNLESLDDTKRITPEDDASDSSSEWHAIQHRKALKVGNTTTHYPAEVMARYPRWPGYINNDYPSITFTSQGTVLFTYGASDYETAGFTIGLKVVIRPIDWLYTDATR